MLDTEYMMFDNLKVGMILREKDTEKYFVIIDHEECQDSYYSTITIVEKDKLLELFDNSNHIDFDYLDYDIIDNGSDGIFDEYDVLDNMFELKIRKTVQLVLED